MTPFLAGMLAGALVACVTLAAAFAFAERAGSRRGGQLDLTAAAARGDLAGLVDAPIWDWQEPPTGTCCSASDPHLLAPDATLPTGDHWVIQALPVPPPVPRRPAPPSYRDYGVLG